MNCNACACEIHRFSADSPDADHWAAHWNGLAWCGPCVRSARDAHKAAARAARAKIPASLRIGRVSELALVLSMCNGIPLSSQR